MKSKNNSKGSANFCGDIDMSIKAIFINGDYAGVLRDIHRVQTFVPEQILYLQPFSGQRIVELSNNRPSTECPVRLFLSLT